MTTANGRKHPRKEKKSPWRKTGFTRTDEYQTVPTVRIRQIPSIVFQIARAPWFFHDVESGEKVRTVYPEKEHFGLMFCSWKKMGWRQWLIFLEITSSYKLYTSKMTIYIKSFKKGQQLSKNLGFFWNSILREGDSLLYLFFYKCVFLLCH